MISKKNWVHPICAFLYITKKNAKSVWHIWVFLVYKYAKQGISLSWLKTKQAKKTLKFLKLVFGPYANSNREQTVFFLSKQISFTYYCQASSLFSSDTHIFHFLDITILIWAFLYYHKSFSIQFSRSKHIHNIFVVLTHICVYFLFRIFQVSSKLFLYLKPLLLLFSDWNIFQ